MSPLYKGGIFYLYKREISNEKNNNANYRIFLKL